MELRLEAEDALLEGALAVLGHGALLVQARLELLVEALGLGELHLRAEEGIEVPVVVVVGVLGWVGLVWVWPKFRRAWRAWQARQARRTPSRSGGRPIPSPWLLLLLLAARARLLLLLLLAAWLLSVCVRVKLGVVGG